MDRVSEGESRSRVKGRRGCSLHLLAHPQQWFVASVLIALVKIQLLGQFGGLWDCECHQACLRPQDAAPEVIDYKHVFSSLHSVNRERLKEGPSCA